MRSVSSCVPWAKCTRVVIGIPYQVEFFLDCYIVGLEYHSSTILTNNLQKSSFDSKYYG